MPKVNPLDYLAIKNVLAQYCEALDSKNFAKLEKVFLPNVTANYPFNSNLDSAEAIQTAIKKRYPSSLNIHCFIQLTLSCSSSLGPIRTHHNLTTQTIRIDAGKKEANAVTYFQGVHFGQGPHEGEVLCAYGKYIDRLVLLEAEDGDFEGVEGASGIWRIVRREVVFTQRIGDERIMAEF